MPYTNNNIETSGSAFGTNRTNAAMGEGLGALGQKYESLRSYGWVIEITPPATGTVGDMGRPHGETTNTLKLACKQIGAIGYTTEDIAVDRVNDKFYYPGKYSTDETTLTFDNFVAGDSATALFAWMNGTFDPVTGRMGQGVDLKQNIKIHQLGPDNTEVMTIHLWGAYPRFWRLSELNYSQSEFHTIEVGVRYDFVTHEVYQAV
tara:strand:+ start:577 stop:1191 length:615 start_codon:yes stop_codon:yes gene_type:complete